jgi:ATP-dependent helicase/nuclease subunit B
VASGRDCRGSSPQRTRAVANAMASAAYSDKWSDLGRRAAAERDSLSSCRLGVPRRRPSRLPSARRSRPRRTAALVTPDRTLARRVSALLARWGIEADDSAGKPLSEAAAGHPSARDCLGDGGGSRAGSAACAAQAPLVGGEDEQRRKWLDDVRLLDLALRGPRPAPGLAGLDRHFEERNRKGSCKGCLAAWKRIRPLLEPLDGRCGIPSLAAFAETLVTAAQSLAGDRGWRGQDGRMAADLLAELQASAQAAQPGASRRPMRGAPERAARQPKHPPPYGGHPRVFIWGLLEARLQQADLVCSAGSTKAFGRRCRRPTRGSPRRSGRTWNAGARISDRAFGARFRQCARRSRRADH